MEMIEEAKKLMDRNEFNQAHDILKSVLRNDANNQEALFYQGLTSRKIGKLNESLKNFDSLINLSPGNANFHSERGASLFEAQEYKAALKDMNKAVELEADNSYRYSSRAFIKNAIDDIEGAIADYSKAIELDPKDIVAINNLGMLHERSGNQEEAKKLFNKADTEAKAQGDLNIDFDLNSLREVDEDGIPNIAGSTEPPVSYKLPEDDKRNIGQIMISVFTSKNEFQGYLKFVKSLFKKNTKTAE